MSNHDNRSQGAIAGAAGALLLGSYLLPGLAGAWAPLRRPLGIEDRTAGGSGWALTFDDGPHAQGTPATLELLERERVRATFFLVGEQIRRNPSLPREILAAGHEIGLHCDRHRNLLRLTPHQVRSDLDRAHDAIVTSTGRELPAAALRLAGGRRARTLLWRHWGREWVRRATAQTIAAKVTAGAGEGSVLLLHDADDYSAPGSWRRMLAALPAVIETMRARDLQAVMP